MSRFWTNQTGQRKKREQSPSRHWEPEKPLGEAGGRPPSVARDEKARGSERAGRRPRVTHQVEQCCWEWRKGIRIVPGIKGGHADKCLASLAPGSRVSLSLRREGLKHHHTWGPAQPRGTGLAADHPTPRSLFSTMCSWVLLQHPEKDSFWNFKAEGQNSILRKLPFCKRRGIGDKYMHVHILIFAGSLWGGDRMEVRLLYKSPAV